MRSPSTKTSPKPSPSSTTSAIHPSATPASARSTAACSAHGQRFDHNIHALRICEHFEQRYAAHRGLNLTLAVREGIIKHSRDYSPLTHPELAAYFLDEAPPLEAQIIDLADEIAYLTADLDDGIESGLLDIAHLRDHVRILSRCFALEVERLHPGIDEEVPLPRGAAADAEHVLTDGPHRQHPRQPRRRSLDDAGRRPPPPAPRRHSSRLEVESERLQEKRYLYDHLYTCPELTLEHDKAEEVVTALFNFWMENPDELPEGYHRRSSPPSGLPRVVADYIAGMTDAYILLQYAMVKRRPRLIRA